MGAFSMFEVQSWMNDFRIVHATSDQNAHVLLDGWMFTVCAKTEAVDFNTSVMTIEEFGFVFPCPECAAWLRRRAVVREMGIVFTRTYYGRKIHVRRGCSSWNNCGTVWVTAGIYPPVPYSVCKKCLTPAVRQVVGIRPPLRVAS